jgi:hypothetical protein
VSGAQARGLAVALVVVFFIFIFYFYYIAAVLWACPLVLNHIVYLLRCDAFVRAV